MRFYGNRLPRPANLPNEVPNKTNLPRWQAETRCMLIANYQYFHHAVEINRLLYSLRTVVFKRGSKS